MNVNAHLLARSLRVLNLLDVLGTLWTVCVLHAEEANPAIGWVLGLSPVLFVIVKLFGVGFASEFLALRGRTWTLAVFNLFYVAAIAAHFNCSLR